MRTDFLVIGSGIAGLSFALSAAEFGSVAVITKKKSADTATNLAQGGVAAVLDGNDSFAEHLQDTLISGAGLCDQEVAEMVVNAGPDRVNNLVNLGVQLIRDKLGKFDLGKEGGHSKRRVAHAYDYTGREIERVLLRLAQRHQDIVLLENYTAVDLLTDNEKKCSGAYVLADDGLIKPFTAGVTVLCTGGCGKVYLYTSNPDVATGDGVAMAMRAGAEIENMEFVQFHPTCLYHPEAKNFLISEAVRGEGGILVDGNGNAFMYKYDQRKDLATRDAVARGIDSEMKKFGYENVFLDITHKSEAFLSKRFPAIYAKCMELGIDISRTPIPVVPAAHYLCGGVRVNRWGESSIAGLMCLGETACTGLHGGNRLASNSLLEALVFAVRAVERCRERLESIKKEGIYTAEDWEANQACSTKNENFMRSKWHEIRSLMWKYVGIVRNDQGLAIARERLDAIGHEIEAYYNGCQLEPNILELRNISFTARMITAAAQLRKESRGLHYNEDYAFLDEKQCQSRVMKCEKKADKWEMIEVGYLSE